MKKTIYILFTALLACASCTDFLEENPTTQLSESSVYSTEASIQANLTGCYNAFQSTALWRGNSHEFINTASALLTWKGDNRTSNDYLDGLKFAKYSTNSYVNSAYNALFSGINRCNVLADNMADYSGPVSAEFRKEVQAEAAFLRAVLYYTAVCYFGDVPLKTSATGSLGEANASRTRFDNIYIQILKDLEFAEENMRDVARVEEVTPGEGRPCKWAATAFKASVYLTIGSLLTAPEDNFWDTAKEGRTPDFSACGIKTKDDAFKLAYETAVNVIENGPYKLESDYRKLFRWTDPEDWYSEESILKLNGSDLVNSRIAVYFLPQGYHTTTKNGNCGRIRPSRWAVENFIQRTGGTKGTGKYNKEVYALTSDPRYAASFTDNYYSDYGKKNVYTYPYDVKNGFSGFHNDNFAPYCIKYYDSNYNVTYGRAGFYVMRFAEMYLIAAESAAWLSSGLGDEWAGKAIDNVNVIRARARKSNDDGIEQACPADFNSADYTDIDDLRYGIWWERFIEMSFEGHEWLDTHRFGAKWLSEKVAVPANTFYKSATHHKAVAEAQSHRTVDEGIYESDPVLLRKSLLMAYPNEEITQNTSLTIADQNDFYWE